MQTITLNNGVKMPALGYGVFRLDDQETCDRCILHAIETGYRLIDTAAFYRNEQWVGNTIRKSAVPRDELFLTTKLWVHEMTCEKAKHGFERSLRWMGLDYIDLFLIHWPFGDIAGTWRALEELVREGKARAIGVCNFTQAHMEELLQTAEIRPVVNQLECHPLLQFPDYRRWLASHDIVTEAWSPIGRMTPALAAHPTLTAIAEAHGKSVAQVILRWHIEECIIPIPKSATESRIESNFDVFDFALTAEELAAIRAMDENFHTNDDPANPATREKICSRPTDDLQ